MIDRAACPRDTATPKGVAEHAQFRYWGPADFKRPPPQAFVSLFGISIDGGRLRDGDLGISRYPTSSKRYGALGSGPNLTPHVCSGARRFPVNK